jgi:hypothetical protein
MHVGTDDYPISAVFFPKVLDIENRRGQAMTHEPFQQGLTRRQVLQTCGASAFAAGLIGPLQASNPYGARITLSDPAGHSAGLGESSIESQHRPALDGSVFVMGAPGSGSVRSTIPAASADSRSDFERPVL